MTDIDIAASHRARLGCSNIAQALGLSRWGTAYQLWERYTGRDRLESGGRADCRARPARKCPC